MDSERLFKIGEVAKMFNVSMGTLRHYEQAGMLVQAYIDSHALAIAKIKKDVDECVI